MKKNNVSVKHHNKKKYLKEDLNKVNKQELLFLIKQVSIMMKKNKLSLN